MPEERSGFLGRWARRKTDVLQGKPLDEPPATAKPAPAVAAAPLPVNALKADPAAAPPPDTGPAGQPRTLLSLDDVKLLTQESDFAPFMGRNVGPEVRNAAMKKLFADPHFNVMDGLDIYIGDYSVADPIPESMLRQMVGAKMLKIFNEDDENKDEDGNENPEAAAARSPVDSLVPKDPNNPKPESVAQSANSPDAGSPQTPISRHAGASQLDEHAHSHLRLQPDHAPSAPGAGHGT
ncbi:MAG: hypothetical protein JWR74_2345 [Polaromonas sp.]|jgi:hypothetical protein|nr:hypothetical protein [Polaromonas sp.]